MARLVLDTNSLIQCIAHRSRYHAIWLTLLDVTEDRHYDILRRTDFPKVNIIKLDEMMRQL